MRLNGSVGARWAHAIVPSADAREKDDCYPTLPEPKPVQPSLLDGAR